MLILLAAGCNIQDVLDDANETFEGLTNPLVVQGWYVGVEPPQDADVDLSGSDFADGAALFRISAALPRMDRALSRSPLSTRLAASSIRLLDSISTRSSRTPSSKPSS